MIFFVKRDKNDFLKGLKDGENKIMPFFLQWAKFNRLRFERKTKKYIVRFFFWEGSCEAFMFLFVYIYL